MIDHILAFFEKQTFGVCAWWGDKLGLSSQRIRLSFIYLSFLTVGSPLVIYLIMAFILENKRYFKLGNRKNSIWEL